LEGVLHVSTPEDTGGPKPRRAVALAFKGLFWHTSALSRRKARHDLHPQVIRSKEIW